MSDTHRMFSDRQDAGRVLAGMLAPRKLRSIVVPAAARRDTGGAGNRDGPERPAGGTGRAQARSARTRGIRNGSHRQRRRGDPDDDIVRSMGVTPIQLDEVTDRERRELARRERIYLAHRSVEIRDKQSFWSTTASRPARRCVALLTVKRASPARVVAAVPVAPRSAVGRFGSLVDDFVVATCPSRFQAVGDAYRDFHQISDREVRELLSAPVIR